MSPSSCRSIQESDTTILIPTYNRPTELKRLLAFLRLLNNQLPIIVLDGSRPDMQKITASFIDDFSPLVMHLQFPENFHIGTRIATALNQHVQSKYVVFCPDDDFIIPNGIKKCAKFLDENPEFSAAIGKVRCLAYPKKYPHLGFFTFLNALDHSLVLDQPTFIARYLQRSALYQLGTPPLFYAVRRTTQAKSIFNTLPNTFKYSSMEMLSDSLTLCYGKSTTLPSLFMIRNYSSETTRDAIREDLEYYIAPEDAAQIRHFLTETLANGPEHLPNDLIIYLLNLFISLPLKKVSATHSNDMPTPLTQYILLKRNWLFYAINYFYPSFMEKLDRDIPASVVRALKKSFQNSGISGYKECS